MKRSHLVMFFYFIILYFHDYIMILFLHQDGERYKEDEKEVDRRQRKYKLQVCSNSQQSNGLTE